MKLKIELTERQLGILIDALECRFRWLLPNQSSTVIESLMNDVMPKKSGDNETWNKAFNIWLDRRKNVEIVAKALQAIIYGDPFMYKYPPHGDISDIWAVLRHVQWLISDEKSDYDIRGDKPIQVGNEPLMKVEVIEE